MDSGSVKRYIVENITNISQNNERYFKNVVLNNFAVMADALFAFQQTQNNQINLYNPIGDTLNGTFNYVKFNPLKENSVSSISNCIFIDDSGYLNIKSKNKTQIVNPYNANGALIPIVTILDQHPIFPTGYVPMVIYNNTPHIFLNNVWNKFTITPV